ncbi:salivary glue protein Sgs-3 [Scomber japonicus]|uniref:salivary glue protein Sgs-3 n=1 Tax=Scomber japonicus TaxID=13676 RepID=UPI002305C56C|nr:salivary glue protein Sgs-3 [Scomber japonicus]
MSPYPSTLQLSLSVCLHVLCVLLLLTDLSCTQEGKGHVTLPKSSIPSTETQGDRVGASSQISKLSVPVSLPSINSTSQEIHNPKSPLNKSVTSSTPPNQPAGGNQSLSLSHSNQQPSTPIPQPHSQDTVTKSATSLPHANPTKASSAGTNTSTGTTTSTTTVTTPKTTVHVTTPAKTTASAAKTIPLSATITPSTAKTIPLAATITPSAAAATTTPLAATATPLSATATTPSAKTDPKPTTKGPKPTANTTSTTTSTTAKNSTTTTTKPTTAPRLPTTVKPMTSLTRDNTTVTVTTTAVTVTSSSPSSAAPTPSNGKPPVQPTTSFSPTRSATSTSTPGTNQKEPDPPRTGFDEAGAALTKQLVDTASLLAVLLFGLLFFLVTVAVFATQAYESYRRKDYTQVDYLINGMYTDSGV